MRALSASTLAASLFILAAEPRAQVSPWVKAKTPKDIEQAYRSKAPYRGMKFETVELEPFVFFIEDQGRGSLAHLGRQRFAALMHIKKLFETRYATVLGLSQRKRPMPFWILKDRNSYSKTAKGSVFTGAYFSLADLHTVTYEDRLRPMHEALAQVMHEATHQIMMQFTDPDRGLLQNIISAWVIKGMAEHLSSRPRAALLKGKDPEFGHLNLDRIRELIPLLRKPFLWKRKSKIPWLHHPMLVMTYKKLPAYMAATGNKRASSRTPDAESDYSQQMIFFYRSSYAVIAFLDLAYKSHFRPKLVALLGHEYGVNSSPRHGMAAIKAAFTTEELAALPGLFDAFVRDPKASVLADLPEGADRVAGASLVDITSGARLFDDAALAEGSVPKLPVADEENVPVLVDLARSLSYFRTFELERAQELIEDIDDPLAKKIDKQLSAMKKLLAGFVALVGKRPGKLRLRVREVGKTKSYRVMEYRELERAFVLEYGKGESTLLPLTQMTPDLFGEALVRAELLNSDEDKEATGVLLGLYLRAASKKEAKKARREAGKRGIVDNVAAFKDILPILDAFEAFEEAQTDITMGKDGNTVLEMLATKLATLPKSKDLIFLTRMFLPRILDKAFLHSGTWAKGLRGKVSLLAAGKVRIEYNWKSAMQTRDWIKLDPKRDGFTMGTRFPDPVAGSKEARLVAHTEEGRLELYGAGFFRHRLQFDGGVELKFKLVETPGMSDDGNRIMQVQNPGVFLLSALRPSSFLLVNVIGDLEPGIYVFSKGRRRASKIVKGAAWGQLWQAIIKGEFITVGVSGKNAYMDVGAESIAELSNKRIEGKGAVILACLRAAKDPKKPSLQLGPIIIEGKPHKQSLSAGKGQFLRRWLGRFPLK